jgi:predicted Zn finger-like uncharacterized protein
MLIVCPSCTTSYMIDPTSVGPGGRTVRCARCRTTWFAGGPKSAPEVTAFVNGVIREAETQSAETSPSESASHSADAAPENVSRAAEDFAGKPSKPLPQSPPIAPKPEPAPPLERAPHHTDLVPREPAAPEPVAIAEAPPLVPPIEHASMPSTAHVESGNDEIETFAARRQRLKERRLKARKSSRWTALILVLFAFNVALVGARNEVVRFLPQTASLFAAIGLPVNLRNLKFENVRITKEAQDGVNSLVIQGSIVSVANKPVEVPRLRFAARNATGQEVYSWTAQPDRSILDAGERLDFNSRLASPPSDASDIMVRFFNSQDAIAGKK